MARQDLLVSLRDLKFRWSPQEPYILDIEELNIQRGARIFLQGPSGSGKTSLLNLLAGVVVPTTGSISILGTELSPLSGPERDEFRADHVGYVFQSFNLIPYLSILDNVLLPLRFSKKRLHRVQNHTKDPFTEAERILKHLGIGSAYLHKRPVTRLSVGQQQRVAVARALIGQPELIVCDEPTSALDLQARDAFLDLLFTEAEETGMTLIYVSHDYTLAHLFDNNMLLGDINRASVGNEE